MSIRTWAVRAMTLILTVTAVAMGCTQKLGVTAPSAPRITPTHTMGANTATFTPTRTWTPTYTSTNTYTSTRTSSPQPSATSTYTLTPTHTSQFTETPTDTWEFSPTFTDSPTDTDTFTLTPTHSPTFTITFTFTSTPTTPVPLDPNMIDNMEDGDPQIAQVGIRDGDWFTMDDGASGGNSAVWPTEGDEFTMSAGGANSAAYAARFTGTLGAAYEYRFVGVGLNFRRPAQPTDPKILYNASAYTGFTFMIKNDGTATTIRVSVPDVDTDPDGGICAPASMCQNNYGMDLHLATGSGWQAVTVFFNLMAQEPAWGYTPPGGFDPSQVYAIQWQAKGPSGSTVDVWVDDVRFVTETGPTPTPSPTPDLALLDNFEDGDHQINLAAGRDGYWYGYYDGTETGDQWLTVSPRTTMVPQPPADFYATSGGSPTSPLYSGHVTGTVGPNCTAAPYNTCPYAGFGFDFIDVGLGNPKQIYDLSAFRGLSFSAKNQAAGLATQWRIKMPCYWTSTVAEGGIGYCAGTGCSNNMGWILGAPWFGTPAEPYLPLVNPGLNDAWQEYQIPFWVMAQENWGWLIQSTYVPTCNNVPNQPNSGCLDLQRVFGVQIQLSGSSGGMNFDFWLDDVKLVP